VSVLVIKHAVVSADAVLLSAILPSASALKVISFFNVIPSSRTATRCWRALKMYSVVFGYVNELG